MAITIGPSTGWLYAQEMFSVSDQDDFIKSSGANGLEMCISWDPRRINSLIGKQRFKGYAYRSLHLPDCDISRTFDEQADVIEEIVDKTYVNTALIHPLAIPPGYFEALAQRNIPLAIENMDKNKTCGYNLTELDNLIKTYDLKFVLDVQHAYEHDHSMVYARELFDVVKNRLAHLHVSGETPTNCHTLVSRCDNSSKILSFTATVLALTNVPIILEGQYDTVIDLKEEIDFMRRNL